MCHFTSADGPYELLFNIYKLIIFNETGRMMSSALLSDVC